LYKSDTQLVSELEITPFVSSVVVSFTKEAFEVPPEPNVERETR
jgi:hypothetical protein